jgi:periplasmic copper chaperone A
MHKSLISGICAILVIPALAATASAHIVLETPQAKLGASYKAVFKVPHGCEGSPTVEVRVDIPEGVIAVKPMPKPGWTIALTKGSYARSYAFYHGEQLGEGVRQVTWTGGPLPDEYFDEFVLSTFIAGEAEPGRVIYFTVNQRCEKGEQRWSEIPATGQSPHALKFPAPQLTLVADATAEAKPVDTATADGKLLIEGAWARPTPEGTSISAGYLKITNRGDKPDTLLGASTPAANSAELHESAVDAEGVMTMRPVENGLEIKPGQTVELKPAGVHIMLLGVKAPLKEGQTVPVTLDFKSAGKVEVPFAVKPIRGAGEHVH